MCVLGEEAIGSQIGHDQQMLVVNMKLEITQRLPYAMKEAPFSFIEFFAPMS